MKNGKLVATLGAVALVAAVGLGSTLAYLSDNAGPVKNTFTLGNVYFDENDLHGALAEQKPTLDEDTSTYTIADKADWIDGFDYLKVTPGEELPKNPTAFIGEESEDAWLFVRVTKSDDFSDINWNDDFTRLEDYDDDDYYYLRLTDAAKKGQRYEIFDKVTVSNDVTYPEDGSEATLDEIVINAALIQAAGFEDPDDEDFVNAVIAMLNGEEFELSEE